MAQQKQHRRPMSREEALARQERLRLRKEKEQESRERAPSTCRSACWCCC